MKWTNAGRIVTQKGRDMMLQESQTEDAESHNDEGRIATKEGTEQEEWSLKEWQEAGRQAEKDREASRPVAGTWTEDFMMRQNEGEHVGKWLSNKSVPWTWRRRLIQANSFSFPCGAHLYKM